MADKNFKVKNNLEIGGSIVLNGNNANNASGVVILDSTGKLPAVDGSNLSGVGASGSALVWGNDVVDDFGSHNEESFVNVSVSAASAFVDISSITFSIINGSLPSGLSITSTGVISGTMPNLTGTQTFNFTIEADDGFNTIQRDFTITVNATNNSPIWNTASDLGAWVLSVDEQLSATDPESKPITYTILAGSLPSGTSLASNGRITGSVSPTGAQYNFTIGVSDGVNTVSRSFYVTEGSNDVGNNGETYGTYGIVVDDGRGVIYENGTTSSIIDTFQIPSGVTQITVVAVGGGGGGGPYGDVWGGGAGAGGAKGVYSVTPSGTLSVTVGGTGVSSTSYASNIHGGDTSLGTLITAGGGQSPTVNSTQYYALGGTAVGGTVYNTTGGNGATYTNSSGTIPDNTPAQSGYAGGGGSGTSWSSSSAAQAQGANATGEYGGGGGGSAAQYYSGSGSNNSGSGGSGGSKGYAGGHGATNVGGSGGSGGGPVGGNGGYGGCDSRGCDHALTKQGGGGGGSYGGGGGCQGGWMSNSAGGGGGFLYISW